jgi:hypothetical protein
LYPNIDQTNTRLGLWTGDEDIKLQEAGKLHSGEDWIAIAAWFQVERKVSVMHVWASQGRIGDKMVEDRGT